MSSDVKKACASCGKQIPAGAAHCVFCNAKQWDNQVITAEVPAASIEDALTRAAEKAADSAEQPTEVPVDTPVVPVVDTPVVDTPVIDTPVGPVDTPVVPVVDTPSGPHASKAGVTLVGLRVEDVQAAMSAHVASAPAPDAPTPEMTPVRGLPVIHEPVPEPVRARTEPPVEVPAQRPFSLLVRLVMASGGLVLIALFSLPWRGASSWQLLETLAGADFVRQIYFIAGGAVLFATAVLPVPIYFRAVIGMFVAALPLVLGAEGLLEGWRGLVAAIAIIALPATHLVRAPRGVSVEGMARSLVVIASAAVALLYLVPLASVMPIVYVARLIASMSAGTIVGVFIGIPLVFAALSLLGAMGRDLASVAVLLAVLILLWPPAAAFVFIHDGTQLYVALALLWTSTTAALCVAQLLTLAAAAPRRA